MSLVLIGAGIGGAVVVTGLADPPPPKPTTKTAAGGTVVAPNATSGSSVQLHMRMKNVIGRYQGAPPVGYTDGTIWTAQPSTNSAAGADPTLKGKLDAIEAKAKDAYDNLSSEAKAAGAKAINDALGTNLTGNESWETMSSVAGGAIGAAAGAAIGGPIGAKIGAIVGAYLGVKLEDLLAKNWDDLQNWLSSQWDDVSGYVEDAANSVGDAASDAAGEAYDYVSGLW